MVKASVILTLAIAPLLVSFLLLVTIAERNHVVDREIGAHRVARVLESDLLGALVDAETGVRGFLLTSDTSFLESYERAVERVPVIFEGLTRHENVEEEPSRPEIERLERLRTLATSELNILSELILRPRHPSALLDDGKAAMDRFRLQIADTTDVEDAELSNAIGKRDGLERDERVVLIAGGLASAIGALVGGVLLVRGIIRRIHIVTENARRVPEGEELVPLDGEDEIAVLQTQLERSAQLLRARESLLTESKEEADRANLAKSEFISRMSHELRTPLNAILGFGQILREESDTTTRADVDQILRAGKHLLALINEVLDLSRIEANQLSTSLEQVAFDEVVQESVELVAPLAAARRITISNDVLRNSTLNVRADRQRLKQVLLNVLSNAIKYNTDGGSVRVSYAVRDDKVVLAVRDTGPGIKEDRAEEIFVPFARLGAEATSVEGTGLGMALSLRLMQVMGGDLRVARTGPEGTEFHIELQKDDTKPVLTHLESVESSSSPQRDSGEVRILQVEDNPANIELVTRIMSRRSEVTLVSVGAGIPGIEAARSLAPDLILLDVNLPDVSGGEVLAALRAGPTTAHIPVIMLSADASRSTIRKLLAAGASAYVTKPFSVADFLSVVDEVLTRVEVA